MHHNNTRRGYKDGLNYEKNMEMEVQTLVVSESDLNSLADSGAISITAEGTEIPVLGANSITISAEDGEDSSGHLPYHVGRSMGGLQVNSITLNVAEVLRRVSGNEVEESAMTINDGQQIPLIQSEDEVTYEGVNYSVSDNEDGSDMPDVSSAVTVGARLNCKMNGGVSSEAVAHVEEPSLEQDDQTHDSDVALTEQSNMMDEMDDTEPAGHSGVPVSTPLDQLGDESSDSHFNHNLHTEASNESTGTGITPNPNMVVIDVSNPIQLCQNSLIVVNGQKCVLQQNPDTGQLLAYPIKEPEKPKRKRGRPRKVNRDQEDNARQSEAAAVTDREQSEDEATEKGLVVTANEAGEFVKRSTRRRKKAQVLNDYETGAIKIECSSEEEAEMDDEEEEEEPPKKRGRIGRRGRRLLSRTNANRPQPLSSLFPYQESTKRGRGRPRRYGLKAPQPQMQAFLIQTMDGQTMMMQVPLASLPAGMTAQSVAQGIADSLNSVLVQKSTSGSVPLLPKIVDPVPPTDELETNESLESHVEPHEHNESLDTPSHDPPEFSLLSQSEQSHCHPCKDSTDSSLSEIGDSAMIASSAENQVENHLQNNAPDEGDKLDNSGVMSSTAVIPLSSSVVPLLLPRQDAPVRIGLKASENDLEKLKCPKCDFQAYYMQQYQNHIAIHIEDVQKCKCCSFHSFDESELIDHYKEHHPKCICTICNHTAEQAYIIKRHMYRHSDIGSTCSECGKTYKDHYILRMHIRMVHMPPEVIYECPTCSKKFNRKAHLKRHLRTHDPDKPYKCPQCEYRGCERSDITKHRLIHEDPQHTCEVCGKTFRHIKNKELHVKRHKGQRDYKCGVCDFFGYTFTDIRKHIERKHTDSKTIICDKCGQAFKTHQLLKEHEVSGQCELFMLEQVLQETEGGSENGGLISNDGNQTSEENDQLTDNEGKPPYNESFKPPHHEVSKSRSLEFRYGEVLLYSNKLKDDYQPFIIADVCIESCPDCCETHSITPIALTEDSIAALNPMDRLSARQIVINADVDQMDGASDILDTSEHTSELAEETTVKRHMALTGDHSHITAEGLTVVTDDEGNPQVAMVTQDGHMLSGVIMDTDEMNVECDKQIAVVAQCSQLLTDFVNDDHGSSVEQSIAMVTQDGQMLSSIVFLGRTEATNSDHHVNQSLSEGQV